MRFVEKYGFRGILPDRRRGIIEEKDKMTVHYTHVTSDTASIQPSHPVFVVKAPKSDKKTEFKKRHLSFGG